jgi:hypothetical protein
MGLCQAANRLQRREKNDPEGSITRRVDIGRQLADRIRNHVYRFATKYGNPDSVVHTTVNEF